ncbi:MAG TPA: RidA family protein [Usitatibacteraceae bacterium]
MAKIDKISTDTVTPPAGHYSSAVVHNGLVYVSGQLPRVPGKPDLFLDTIEAQTRQALANAEAILLAAGSRRDRVLKATLYVSDIALWAQVNAEYAAFFGDHRPARAIVPVGKFRNGFLIEIEMVAALAD